MSILRLNFITKLIFIHLFKYMIFLAKLIALLTTLWITMYTCCCISPLLHHYPLLILLLISGNLIIFTPSTGGVSYVVIAPTVTTFWESKFMLHHYPALGKVQLPISWLDDVLEKWCHKIIKVWYFISTNI